MKPAMAGIKNIILHGSMPLKNNPAREAVNVALKNKPTSLPRLALPASLAINIKASGMTEAPNNPVKNLATNKAWMLLESPEARLAIENKAIQNNSIFLESNVLTSGP